MKARVIWSLVGAVAIAALYCGTVLATGAQGFSGMTVVTGRFDEIDVKAHTNPASFWQVRLKTQGQSDLFVQSNKWDAGGTTGWHTHPGPSLIVITSGLVTTYEADDPDCTPHDYGPNTSLGPTFVDPGGQHTHVIRNETGSEARGFAIQLIPPLGAAGRRIDAPHPNNCPLGID